MKLHSPSWKLMALLLLATTAQAQKKVDSVKVSAKAGARAAAAAEIAAETKKQADLKAAAKEQLAAEAEEKAKAVAAAKVELVAEAKAFAEAKAAAKAELIEEAAAKAKIAKAKAAKNAPPSLIDALNQATCSYRSLKSVLQQFKLKSKADEILRALYRVHPYMAYQIRREMDQQQWCLSPNLKFMKSDDSEVVTDSYLPGVDVAIREIKAKKVFVFVPKFLQLSENDQAMTLIGEAVHSFLDKDLAARTLGFRSVCQSIYDNYIESSRTGESSRSARVADLETMIKATSTTDGFKSTEFGQVFGKLNDNAPLTDEDWTLLFSKTPPDKDGNTKYLYQEQIDLLTDKLGRASVVGGQLSHVIDPKNFAVWNQAEKIREYSRSEIHDDANPDPFSEPARVQVGQCDLTKKTTSVKFDSAGFWSSVGWEVDFDLEVAVRLHGTNRLLFKKALKAYTKNHSIFVSYPLKSWNPLDGWPKLEGGIDTKVAAVMDLWESKLLSVGRYLMSGACNDPHASDRKYLP